MVTAAAVSLYLQLVLKWDSDRPRDFAYIMIVTVAVTTIAWLAVTWMTPPEPAGTLEAFYRRVRPHPGGWGPVARAVGGPSQSSLRSELTNAVLGCVLVYGALFGMGEILLRSVAMGVGLLGIAAVAAYVIARNLDHPSAADTTSTS
jgi:hypothetical protein